MGCVSRHRAAREMLPITKQRCMREAVRWCSGRLRVNDEVGAAGAASGVSVSCKRSGKLYDYTAIAV
jgi:hypothetical protein